MGLIAPLYKSIVRATTEMIANFNTNPDLPATQWHNWESRNEEGKLPEITLIGIEGFSFNENNGLWLIRYGMAISSMRDANLLHEIDLLDAIHQRFGQNNKVPLVSMVDAAEVNELVVSHFEILPMGQSELRNYRSIGVELARTGV